MIFPLDIFRLGAGLYWVIYNAFCEQEIEQARVLAYGEALLANRQADFLTQFAWDAQKNPPKLTYSILKGITPTLL
jgi:hypothetical protein